MRSPVDCFMSKRPRLIISLRIHTVPFPPHPQLPLSRMDFCVKEVQAGLKYLDGEGDVLLGMMAAGCESSAEWTWMLEGPLERACITGETNLAVKLVRAGARVSDGSFLHAATEGNWDTVLKLLALTPKGGLGKVTCDFIWRL